ncbi:MAG TPA: hypothetical protein VHV30_00780, partial [Polyangiaceae bacterium]|nr:hypothetical protein [Polyangiaceae bacterium]
MIRKFWRGITAPIVFAGLTAPFIANCGGGMPGMSGLPGGGGLPGAGNCPDVTKVEAIESFDFEKEFKLKADVAAKIKAGTAASVELEELNAKIDGDLKTACGGLAHDLGATGDFASGQDACKAAEKAIADAKVKMGGNLTIKLDFSEPHCGVDVEAYGSCAGHCDASVTPGKAEVKCEPGKLQGECSGGCSGDCELNGSAACSGECSGTCDAEIKGSCSGNCVGKCDGKATPAGSGGACAGTCEGKCSGNVKATCKGKCGGSCHLAAQASCSGTCSGSCSVEMKAPKCTGQVEPPKMSAECKAKCDAKLSAKAECIPPHIAFRITGAADVKAQANFQAAIEKNLPGILNVSIGLAKHAVEAAEGVEVVVKGVQAGIQGAGDPMTIGRLTACVGAPFKGAIDAVAS